MGISTIPCLNENSTIFKTINSSVDETRKTLALFNKDWNTYKTNWQQGFSQNGFVGGVKSIFQSSGQNSVISKDQVQILRNWNNAVTHGCTNQETFNRIIANADDNTKMYFAGLNKCKGSIEGLKNAQNVAKQSTIGLTIAQTALNMAISMGLMAAISLAINGFDKLVNSAKRASEAADEAFSDTNEKVQQNEEEAKSLDELISKYKELKESGNLDIDGRKEVKELQNDIADLVGTQAKNLDLVNGKLDDEIKKLDEISAKEAKNAYETATANYNNSKKANAEATGDDSFLFVDGYAYTGKREKEAEKILKDAGFGNNNVQSGGFFGNTLFVMDSFDNNMKELKGAQEKADYLQSMIDVLEQNGQRSTDLYAGLIKQRDAYLKYIDNQQNAANSLVNSWITYSQFSNEELSKINVDSVESFDTYRQKMIEEAKKDESIGKILADGTLSDEDLEKAVNDFMATSLNFSKWYEQWLGNVQGSTSEHETDILSGKSFKQIWDSLGTGTDETSKKVAEEKENLLKLAEAGQLTEEAFKDSSIVDTFTEAGYSISEATKEVNDFIENVKQLNSMKTGISAITSAYDEKKDANDKRVGSDTLNSMYDTLGVKDWSKPDLKVWEQYKEVASSSKSTLKELKSAQDDLATSFVNSNNFLSNITDGTKDYYVSLLREMGVTNAAELATDALNRKKIEAKLASFDYADATDSEIEELNKYILSLGGASSALANYMIQKQIASGALDTSGSIKNLINLAKQCGATTKVLEALQRVLNATDTLTNTKSKDLSEYNADAVTDLKHIGDDLQKQKDVDVEKDSIKLEKAKNKLNKLLKKARTAVETSKGNQDKNKDKGSGSGSNSKNTTKKEKTEINWLERRLTRMQSIIDITASKLQNLFSIKSKSNNLDKQIKQTTKLVKQYGHAYNVYMGKANKVAKASKKGKNKVPALSKDIINKVQSGEITKSSYRKLIKKYGQNYADKINSYIDYYDKAQEAKQNRQEQIAKKRQLKIDKKQLRVDKANAKIDSLETKKEYATSSESKNDYLKKEKKYYQDSYKYQIQIAKLEGNKVEAQRLQVELQQKLRDIQKEQLENTENQQQAELDRIQAQKERAKDYGSKNNNIDAEIAKTNELYDTQIAIANLEGNTEEAQKLQIEREQQLIALQKEKFD